MDVPMDVPMEVALMPSSPPSFFLHHQRQSRLRQQQAKVDNRALRNRMFMKQ